MNGREGETIGDCVSFPIISGGDDDEAVPATLLFELALPVRDAVGATLTIMLADRVDIAGVTLEVVGRPRRPTRPSLGEHHVEVRARLVEG